MEYRHLPSSWIVIIDHQPAIKIIQDHHPGKSTWIINIDHSHQGSPSCFPSTPIHMDYHLRTLPIHRRIIDHQHALSVSNIIRDQRDKESLIIIITINDHHHELPPCTNSMDRPHGLYSTSPTRIMKPTLVLLPDRPSYRCQNRHE